MYQKIKTEEFDAARPSILEKREAPNKPISPPEV